MPAPDASAKGDAGATIHPADNATTSDEDGGTSACAQRMPICAAGDAASMHEYGAAVQDAIQSAITACQANVSYECGPMYIDVDAEGCVQSVDCSRTVIFPKIGDPNQADALAEANAVFCDCLESTLERKRFACAAGTFVSYGGSSCTD
jgi:hypothetical protein